MARAYNGVVVFCVHVSHSLGYYTVLVVYFSIFIWKFQSGISTNLAGPTVIPVMDVFPWDGLGGYHNNVAGPSDIPATNFYPWDGLGAYHGGAPLPPVYYNEFVEAPREDYNNKYYDYSTSLMESGSSFYSGANNYMGIPPGPNNYMGIPSGANNYMGIPPGVEPVLPWGYMPSTEMPHQPSQTKIINSEIDEKYKTFKQFDTVSDHSDNFYSLPGQMNVHAVNKVAI